MSHVIPVALADGREFAADVGRLAIVHGPRPAEELLREGLASSRFDACLEQIQRSLGRPTEELRVVIKSDMDFFEPGAPTGTSPALVEALIDELADRGYRDVAVIDGCNVDDSWLFNREPLSVPDLAGYRFSTSAGRSYEICGAGEALTRFALGDTATELATSGWLNADVRIVFAKNKTDEGLGFALGLFNLLGLLPNARSRTQGGLGPAAPSLCVELLRRAPVHFALIDAVVSSHGPAGGRKPNPIETNTLIAGPSLLLVDWAAAVKMGADPYTSPLNALALRQLGLPTLECGGDLSPYPFWLNPHPLAMDSVRNRQRSRLAARFFRAFSQPVDREAFPIREMGLDRMNALFTEIAENGISPEHPAWWTVPINYLVGALEHGAEAFNILHQKDRLNWVELPLQLDHAAIAPERYEEIAPAVENLERMLKDAPRDRHGCQSRPMNGAVLFRASCILENPFDSFVECVAIHRAIQFMNDYIGGSAVAVRTTADGHVDRQVERNLYLPQPNWSVLFGGSMIDVEKIEAVAYERDRHKIWWQTIQSPNRSADCDDGSVEFRRTATGNTEVIVFTFQKFRQPAARSMQMFPEMYRAVIESAYANFFTSTIRNLKRQAEGHPHRIGHRREHRERESATSLADLSVWAAALVGVATDFVRQSPDLKHALGGLVSPRSVAKAAHVDEHGFRHFVSDGSGHVDAGRGPKSAVPNLARILGTAPTFLRGLAEAIQKDAAGGGGAES